MVHGKDGVRTPFAVALVANLSSGRGTMAMLLVMSSTRDSASACGSKPRSAVVSLLESRADGNV